MYRPVSPLDWTFLNSRFLSCNWQFLVAMPDFIPSRVSELKSVQATHKTRGCTNLMRRKVKDLFLEHYMFATIFEVNFLNYTTAASDLQCKLTQKMKIWGGRKERNIQIDKKTEILKQNWKILKQNQTTPQSGWTRSQKWLKVSQAI